jgi:hypothetical protein
VSEPTDAPPNRTTAPQDEAAEIRTCPNCGRRLLAEKCRLRCPDPACGYYLSCSDYY